MSGGVGTSERETQLQSPVSDERRKIFMADNGDDDVSGNSQDMSSRFCVTDNGEDQIFDISLSKRIRSVPLPQSNPLYAQTVMVFVSVVRGRVQQDEEERSGAAADCLRTRWGSMGRRN